MFGGGDRGTPVVTSRVNLFRRCAANVRVSEPRCDPAEGRTDGVRRTCPMAVAGVACPIPCRPVSGYGVDRTRVLPRVRWRCRIGRHPSSRCPVGHDLSDGGNDTGVGRPSCVTCTGVGWARRCRGVRVMRAFSRWPGPCPMPRPVSGHEVGCPVVAVTGVSGRPVMVSDRRRPVAGERRTTSQGVARRIPEGECGRVGQRDRTRSGRSCPTADERAGRVRRVCGRCPMAGSAGAGEVGATPRRVFRRRGSRSRRRAWCRVSRRGRPGRGCSPRPRCPGRWR